MEDYVEDIKLTYPECSIVKEHGWKIKTIGFLMYFSLSCTIV